ncbi:hypothetical protein QBC40DRAFT_316070 [Triangularia verruculosa]|uniref:DUF7371 domain-containing protein n=1 Tax=Triangularia verruculosa TaxID=2587418 RepID=A0AAN6X7B6_9PEZI|nr:hypothetical protein QBC40DRAFT_316070 [Triangularia verruculosa]
MRVHASLGALAGIAWLSEAAAVPRADVWGFATDTTCTTTTPDQATVIVLPGQSAASDTAPTVFTFTLSANDGPGSPDGGSTAGLSGSLDSSSGLANGPPILSTTCTSSETPLVPGEGSGLSGLVTVTVPGLPTPSAPAISTVTVPVLTVTLPGPAVSLDSSIVTVTVQPGGGSSGSEATPTPVITATVPDVGVSNSVGVVTVTIPEGPSDTATVVLTVTVPTGSDSPGAWSTIITAPGASGASTGPPVTVTIFTSPVTAVPGASSLPPLEWSSESTALVTVPLETGYGSNSLPPLGPYTLTYTMPLAPGLTELSIATVTVTPVDLSVPTGVGPFATDTLSSGVSSWSYVPSPPGTSVVSFTVSASGTVPAYTGVITVTPGFSWGTPAPVITGPPGFATITAPEATVTVVSPSFSPSLPAPSSPGEQSGVVTVTVPQGAPSIPLSSGSGGGIFTVSAPQQTVVVSEVTISQTISLGPGSSTVLAITTQVTLPASPASPSSGVFVTPSLASYTIADSYGNPTTLTQWTYVPVLPSDSGAGAGQDGGLASDGTAQFTTILASTPVSVITVLPSAAPSVITVWPSTNTADPDQAQSNSASPSEITLWPLPTSIDTTCTTFSTSYRPQPTSASAAASSSFSVITVWPSTSSPPYSVITVWPSSEDSALAGWPTTDTCTETLAVTSVILLSSVSSPFTSFPTALTSDSSDSSALAIPTETAEVPLQPENTESPPSQPENTEVVPVNASDDLIPPPQTEFNRHGQRAQTVTFGGYAFSSSAAAYGYPAEASGDPIGAYGLPEADTTSIETSALPVSATSSSAVDLTSLLSSIVSVLSANATFVSGPGPILTSIPAASSNNTPSVLPTTTSSLLVDASSLTAAPIATGSSSLGFNATGTSSRGLPASTCGAVGDRGLVVFNFDDIPTISNGTEASDFPAMPVPFPYHRFFFSNGFSVVAPPRTKFKPSSGEQLIQHNSSVSPVAEFGLAQLRSNPCFHFSFSGVSLGCGSTTDPCVFNITGLRWNGTDNVVEAQHTFEVAACSKDTDCSLSHQILDSAAELPFSNLTSLNISLTVAGKPETWWADNLQIAWADNDCTAAACRSLVPNTIMIPHMSRTFSSRAKRLLRWAVRRNDDEFH